MCHLHMHRKGNIWHENEAWHITFTLCLSDARHAIHFRLRCIRDGYPSDTHKEHWDTR